MDIFDEMRRLQEEMERAFSSFYESPNRKMIGTDKGKELAVRRPMSDLIETDKEIIAKIELPGIEKKDVHLNINENSIEIKAEQKKENKIEKKGFFRQERSYSQFYRVLPLPAEVDPNKARAKMENGLLEIVIPKIGRTSKGKIIEIK